jgi:hypothetical protein
MTDRTDDSFLSLHSPRGAGAHFALGQFGRGGGFGLQSDRAVNNDVFIGFRRGNEAVCLPFFNRSESAEIATFLGEQKTSSTFRVSAIPREQVRRTFGSATDRWEAPGISFEIITPWTGIPDPAKTDAGEMKASIVPGLAARLTIDNTNGNESVQGFFGTNGFRGLRPLEEETRGKLCGWAGVQGYGFACHPGKGIKAVAHWDLASLFTPPHPLPFRLTGMPLLLVDAPAGTKRTTDIALGWFKPGIVTEGPVQAAYLYTKYFHTIADVLDCCLDNHSVWHKKAVKADKSLSDSPEGIDRAFLYAQSVRSYWASSMLFRDQPSGRIRWVVNEGSFVMINTFDLAVDHLFFELDRHPWAVRNVLDAFADEYSYADRVRLPGSDRLHPGGISFSHDHGSYNTFAPEGLSSYEVRGQSGCYAYMTHEQLVNWVVSAAQYYHTTRDTAWIRKRKKILLDCLRSLLNRDHPDPAQRDGVMDLDSELSGADGEISTYDSLDPSLGQARRNIYLAVKTWAAYLGLESLFRTLKETKAAETARRSAVLCAKTVADGFDPALGFIPSILDGKDKSPIIPAVEGLVFPYLSGQAGLCSENGPFGQMVTALKKHLQTILKPGLCQFADGGWKLSARSENSWISKVFLCQFIAERILGIERNPAHDRVHADWWRIGSKPNPGIDQIFAGKTTEEGFYYPRGVTSFLWFGGKTGND